MEPRAQERQQTAHSSTLCKLGHSFRPSLHNVNYALFVVDSRPAGFRQGAEQAVQRPAFAFAFYLA